MLPFPVPPDGTPPQTIILLPVQTTLGEEFANGAPVVDARVRVAPPAVQPVFPAVGR